MEKISSGTSRVRKLLAGVKKIKTPKLFVMNPFKGKSLKENARYKMGEYGYNVETDENGRISRVFTSNLQKNKKEKLKAGTPEHKEDRWKIYKKKHPDKSYEEWSNRYDANMKNASRGNASANEYQKEIGWGKREVSIKNEDGKIIRKLDIADEKAKKAIEIKDYSKKNVPYSKEIQKEVEIDKNLIEQGWDIEWVFKNKGPSKSLEEALNAPPPIKVKII